MRFTDMKEITLLDPNCFSKFTVTIPWTGNGRRYRKRHIACISLGPLLATPWVPVLILST